MHKCKSEELMSTFIAIDSSYSSEAGKAIVKVKFQLPSLAFVTENHIQKMSQPSHVLVSDQRCNSCELM